MNRLYCEKEAEIIAAMRSRGLSPELEKHAGACDICCGSAAVSKFLRPQEAVRPFLPDSDFLWWKALLASRQLAVERATRPIVLVRTVACCGFVAAALWLLLSSEHASVVLAAMSKRETWSSALGQSALLMALGALVFTLLGSFYFARLEK